VSAGETFATWRLLRELRAGLQRPPGELAALQDELLRSAVEHAYREIPFYRRLWDAHGVRPGDIAGAVDLQRLPIVDGAAVREAAAEGMLLSKSVAVEDCSRFTTSGTSGSPLTVWRGPAEQRLWRAFGLRTWLEHGFRWRDATLRFDRQAGPPHALQRLGISRTTWVSTATPAAGWPAAYTGAGAAFLVGTPTVLRRLCAALDADGTAAPAPRVVFSHGELLDTWTRRTVRTTFGVDPVSLYGLAEVGVVAWQCKRREGFHVNADGYLVELLRAGRPAAPGELGTLVVTALRGRTMPLLRYDTGDLAVAGGSCPCDLGLPTLASLEGRASDAVTLESGRILTARAIVERLAEVAGPDAYRLRQESLGRFRLATAPSVAGGEIAARVLSLLGDVEIAIEPWVEPRLGAEKTRTVTAPERAAATGTVET
jgi:phenylacetate-CoA ligase